MQHYPQSEAILSELDTLSRTLTTIAQQETDPSGPLPLYPSTAARLAWKTYKFRESLRRTLLVVFQTISVCNLLLGRLSTCHHLAADNRVTFSAHLWHAESAFDFAVAWNDPGKRHFLVRDMDITELLEVARPEDVDVFGKVMLTGILGVDDVRGWFVMRGGAL